MGLKLKLVHYCWSEAVLPQWLQLTRQAGSWIPRLERMVTSRGLSDFEKSILLSLIGMIIQPNKVITGKFCVVCVSVAEQLILMCTIACNIITVM